MIHNSTVENNNLTNKKNLKFNVKESISGPLTSIIMVNPTHFKVDYAINPFMSDENGNLQKVNADAAMLQWQALKNIYLELGLSVIEIDPSQIHPDMVFTANQLFPFRKQNENGYETQFILSHMATAERAGEVLFFKKWAQKNNYKTHQLPVGPFEGMGDALWNYDHSFLFLGYGFRTHLNVAKELEKFIAAPIQALKLVSPHFYHLDTCLAVLNQTTCAYVKEAFEPKSLESLQSHFETLIEVPSEEAMKGLACNMFCPDGKTVIIDQINTETIARLKDYKFDVRAVDTSEFRKSGGSVFCLKLGF